jgi:hypothetical protein
VIGLCFVLAAVGSFWGLARTEASGDGTRRMNFLIALWYMLGGKWLVLVGLGLMGVSSVVVGVLCMTDVIWVDDDPE